jgi:hypothetical protein
MVILPHENLTLVTFLTYVTVACNCVSSLLSKSSSHMNFNQKILAFSFSEQ